MKNRINNEENRVANKQQKGKERKVKWKIAGMAGVIATSILIGIGVYNIPSQRLARQLSLGYKYLENQQYEEAIIAFSNVISIDSKCLEAYAGSIEAYKNMDKTEDMQLLYDNALSAVRSLETDVFMQNEEMINKLYISADEVYKNDTEKAIQILEEGLNITENNEDIKKELDELNAQKANIIFMQKVYDLMAQEDYESMSEVADSEEASSFVTGMQEESYIYIPEDHSGLNGLGAGVYKDGEGGYYYFYGNYVNGKRTGQGTSYIKISEEDKKLYYFEGIYRVFTGEWKNDVPNGYGREEFVYLNYDDYAEQSGNIVSEGNLQEGLWDGEIQCDVSYSLKTPILVEFEMGGSYLLANGVPAEEGTFIPGNENYPGIYIFAMAESGSPYRWIEGHLNEGETIGTIGYGDVNVDETMTGFGVLQ